MSQLNFTHCPLRPEHVPRHWKVVAVGQIVDSIQSGFASGKHNSEGVGVPHLRPMNISPDGTIDLTDARFVGGENPLRVRRGDILFNNTNSPAWVGKTAVIETDDDYAFSNHMTRLRVFSGIAPAFVAKQLHFLCRSGYFQHQCKKHVNQASINRTFLGNATPVVLAPKNEQKRIVAKIDSLQERSSRARVALAEVKPLLEQFRQSVLQAAFSGRLTADWRARHPDIEPASELLARIRAERRRRWEQAQLAKYEAKGKKPPKNWKEKYPEPESADANELPELPEGWCWTRWEEVGFCQNGRAFPSKHYAESGVKLLRPGNLHVSGDVVWTESNMRFMPVDWEAKHPAFIVGGNELVMNLTAQSLKDEFLGRVCFTGPGEHCLLNQRIARITPVPPLTPDFCLLLFKSRVFRRYVDTLNTGSLIQHIFTTQIFDFAFPLPPLEEQAAILEAARTVLKAKNTLAQVLGESSSTLTQLECSIIAKAFRGELVAQDPSDEPATQLLKHIHAPREAERPTARQKRKRIS